MQLAELVAFPVVRQNRQPRHCGTQREILTFVRDARREDRVLQLVVALRELSSYEAPLAGLPQPVQPFVLVSVGPLLFIAQRPELLATEEVRVASHDGRLLRDLLLADSDRPSFLRSLEEIALKVFLELRWTAD